MMVSRCYTSTAEFRRTIFYVLSVLFVPPTTLIVRRTTAVSRNTSLLSSRPQRLPFENQNRIVVRSGRMPRPKSFPTRFRHNSVAGGNNLKKRTNPQNVKYYYLCTGFRIVPVNGLPLSVRLSYDIIKTHDGGIYQHSNPCLLCNYHCGFSNFNID